MALAGCSAPGGDDQGGGNYSWPGVPNEHLQGWEKAGTETDVFSRSAWWVGVDAYVATEIYNDVAIRQDVREKTMGQFDEVLATFFATKINLEGLGTRAVTASEIADRLFPEFRSQMEEYGVQNVEETETSSPAPSNHDPVTKEYSGTFPTPAIEREVSMPDVETKTLHLPADELEITGLASAWKTNTGTGYAGGAVFPAENFSKKDTISLTGAEGSGIDVTISVDLGLDPTSIRNRVVGMIESIE
ncbi:hypothetical protein BRC81_03955 [Halobacteriales archaeon QS_1_68_20]|nr:MAG: hypothetical protein BRC81_03955 [Halobacteriales archaeon QS_1_68_20]